MSVTVHHVRYSVEAPDLDGLRDEARAELSAFLGGPRHPPLADVDEWTIVLEVEPSTQSRRNDGSFVVATWSAEVYAKPYEIEETFAPMVGST